MSEHQHEDQAIGIGEAIDQAIADPDITPTFWYNERTGEVEEGPQSLAVYRLGPFATREEAARGPQIVLERAQAIRDDDDD